MRKLLTGEQHANVYDLVDPTTFSETAFEVEVLRGISQLMPEYICGVFAGAFMLENERRVADLALIHKTLSHWFVVEVELASHSLHGHVLPQVRCFRYGDPESSCTSSLLQMLENSITRDQANSLITQIPRYVAVISNLSDPEWKIALNAIDVQYLTITTYRDASGQTASEVEGSLFVRAQSLGFAQFSATDNCLRIPRGCDLPTGNLNIVDQFGNPSEWTAREQSGILWIHKDHGPALIAHNSYVQIIRDFSGRISIRISS